MPSSTPAARDHQQPHLSPEGFDIRTRVYIVLACVFVTCLLVADITGSKFFTFDLFTIGSYSFVTHSVGMFTFPVTFLITDLVNEYYGKRGARRLTYLGLGMCGLAFFSLYLARKAPTAAASPISQESFDAVFFMAGRLYVASLTAYFLGQLADIWLFGVLKKWTNGKLVWLRATGSTVISQALDSFLVTSILLYGTVSQDGSKVTWAMVMEFAATGYILKFMIAIGLTPLVHLGRWALRELCGMRPMPVDQPE